MKKWILKLLLLLLFFTGCRTKHLKIERNEEKISERKEIKKDSLSEIKNETKTASFSFEKEQSFEMEIISDKEKDSVIFEKIRSPTSEKIIVRGGSLRFKTTHHTADKITKKDTLRVNNTSVRTEIKQEKVAEKQVIKKEKETSRNLSLNMIFWIILLLAIVFIAWRLKLFKIFSSFKKYLNRN